jgi:hypothetical protein
MACFSGFLKIERHRKQKGRFPKIHRHLLLLLLGFLLDFGFVVDLGFDFVS